jgi:hypothetical protein
LCSAVLTVRANSGRPCGADDVDVGGVVELGGEIFARENLYDFHGTMVLHGGNGDQSSLLEPANLPNTHRVEELIL